MTLGTSEVVTGKRPVLLGVAIALVAINLRPALASVGPVLDDLGSGALVDLSRHGLVAEPTVHASVTAGADVITLGNHAWDR